MNKRKALKEQIERERKILDNMLESGSMEDALEQSRKVDQLMERYMDAEQG